MPCGHGRLKSEGGFAIEVVNDDGLLVRVCMLTTSSSWQPFALLSVRVDALHNDTVDQDGLPRWWNLAAGALRSSGTWERAVAAIERADSRILIPACSYEVADRTGRLVRSRLLRSEAVTAVRVLSVADPNADVNTVAADLGRIHDNDMGPFRLTFRYPLEPSRH